MSIQGVITAFSSVSNSIKKGMHNPGLMAAGSIAALFKVVLEPISYNVHPDLKNREDYHIITRPQALPVTSSGSLALSISPPVIFVREGLKEEDSEAFEFFLKREIKYINSKQAFIEPLVQIVTSVSLAVLIPTSWSFFTVCATWYVVNSVSKKVFDYFYGEPTPNRFLEIEKKASGEFDLVAKHEEYIRPSFEKLQSDELPKEAIGFFKQRTSDFKQLKSNDIEGDLLSCVPGIAISIAMHSVIPYWVVMAVFPVTNYFSNKLVKPIEENRLKQQLENIDLKISIEKRRAANKWLEEQTDPRLQKIIPAAI